LFRLSSALRSLRVHHGLCPWIHIHPATPLRPGACLNQAVFLANAQLKSTSKMFKKKCIRKKEASVETEALANKLACF